MKYFLNTDDSFMNIHKIYEIFIDNSYMNENTCEIPSKTRKIKIPHILETSPTHATGCDGKKVFHRKI